MSLEQLFDDAREHAGGGSDAADEIEVTRALMAGRARRRRTQRRRGAAAVTGLGVLVAVFAWGGAGAHLPSAQDASLRAAAPSPTLGPAGANELVTEPRYRVARAALDGGHELTTVAGTEYAVVPTAAGVRVRLASGAALFDVRHLEEGHEFVVETADTEVHVVGTVFAVERAGGDTAVRTFEGHVRVLVNGASHELGAGGSWGMSHGGIEALTERGRRAARERNATAAVARPVEVRPAPRRPVHTPRAETRAEAVPRVRLDTARRWISRGDAERALDVASPRADDPEWGAVAADALRALGRWSEAAQRYDDVAQSLGEEGTSYGLLAAQLRLRRLRDARGAVRSIERSGVHLPGSPLRERGLALLVEALFTAGDMPAFSRAADEYRRDFPQGSRSAWIDARQASAGAVP